MAKPELERLRALLPGPDVDLAALLRDDERFAAAAAALADLIDPEVESIGVWRGGAVYAGISGFREMWLDWLQPWGRYYSEIEEMIEDGDRVAILVRDRGLRDELEQEVELRSGSVWSFREGKVTRVEFYGSREELFEATGLPRKRG
jgi:ketosteroid isomerase-like protein